MRQTRSSLPAHRREIVRRVTGTPEQVAAIVRTIRASGRLLAMTEPQQAADGSVWVNVRFLDRIQPTAVARRRRRWPVAAAAAAGVTVLAVGAYALIQLVNAVIALLPYIAGGLLLLALVTLLTGGRAGKVACVTFHGPGCRHH